jgi:hypothetical protein
MNTDFDMYLKEDMYLTPILRKLINKYGTIKIFNNKKLIKDPRFYIMFISMQDYDMYKKIGSEFKLFIFNFIKYITNDIVKDFVGNVINIDGYKNIDDYNILSLWNLVYDVDCLDIKYSYINKLKITKILNKSKEYKKYNYNDVVKFLLFVWYSKYDLGKTILLQDLDENMDEDITELHNSILEFIDSDKSIFHYTYISDIDYPIFESSQKTLNSYRNLPDIINTNLDPGYVWKSPEYFIKMDSYGLCTNMHDTFFSLLYRYLSNGIVTNNILAWTYLFGYGKIDPLLLNELFSIIMNIPIEICGLISDLYSQSNKKAINTIISEIKNTNIRPSSYLQGQQNIDIQNMYLSLPDTVINIIAQKPFEPRAYFTNFGININEFSFNNNFFEILLYNHPLKNSMMDIKNKISITKDESHTDFFIKIYNTNNFILAKNNKFEIIKDYNISVIDNVDKSNINYFNLGLIKTEILNILFQEYYFIPENKSNLREQYNSFIMKKLNLTNIYNCLINKDIEKTIKNIINRDIYLKTIFRDI